jgi:hypothetical protein
MKRIFAVASALLLLAAVGQASEHEAPMKKIAETKIKTWISDPVIVNAVKAQNEKHASLTQADVDKLDKQWRAETKAAAKPLIDPIVNNDLSKFLKKVAADSKGLYTEIFVMDNKGLNVGQSDITSDYWQGDEAKWQKTYSVGASAIHISDVSKDESTQSFQSQLSLPVVDPASNQVIGAVTIGINVEQIAH